MVVELQNATNLRRAPQAERDNYLRRFRAGLMAYRTGAADVKIGFLGPSTMAGVDGSSGTAAFPNNPAMQLGALLTAKGYNVARQDRYASGGLTIAQLLAADSRIAVTGTWTPTTKTRGGRTLNATAAATIAFTPTESVDTFEIEFIQNSSSGSININIDGGANTLVSLNGSNAIKKTTLTAGSAGTHTVNIAWASGSVAFVSIRAYVGGRKNVILENYGYSGSVMGDITTGTSPWETLTAINASPPHVLHIGMGVNDARGISSSTPTTFDTLMRGAIDTLGPNMDIILETLSPDGDTSGYPTISTYRPLINDAIRRIAQDYGLPLIDADAFYQSYTAADAFGYLNTDKVHFTKKGHALRADMILQALRM